MMAPKGYEAKLPRGRPRREVPRRQKHVYMTDRTINAVEAWRAARIAEDQKCSYCDAVEQMLEVAASYTSNYKPRNSG